MYTFTRIHSYIFICVYIYTNVYIYPHIYHSAPNPSYSPRRCTVTVSIHNFLYLNECGNKSTDTLETSGYEDHV